MPDGLIVTWPGGIGNPIGEHIPTSGGAKKRKGRKTRKQRKHRKSHRKSRRGMSACASARRCWTRRG